MRKPVFVESKLFTARSGFPFESHPLEVSSQTSSGSTLFLSYFIIDGNLLTKLVSNEMRIARPDQVPGWDKP